MTNDEARHLERDALERYWRAVELVDAIREAWVEQGSWLTVTLANGVEAEAPLLKLLRECERDCERFARAVPKPKTRTGRPPSAVLEPVLAASPAARLRKVDVPTSRSRI